MATHVKDLTLTNASDDGRTYHVLPDWHLTRYDGGWRVVENATSHQPERMTLGSILVPFLGDPDAIWLDQFDGAMAFEEARPSVFDHGQVATSRSRELAMTLNDMDGSVTPVDPYRREPVLVLYDVPGDVVPDRLRDRVNRLVSEVNRLVNDGGADFDVANELKEGMLDQARVADKLKGDGRRFNEARYLQYW